MKPRSALPFAVSFVALGVAVAAAVVSRRAGERLAAATAAPRIARVSNASVDLQRGDSARFFDLEIRLSSVAANDPDQPLDDSAEISLSSPFAEKQSILQRGRGAEFEGYSIAALEIAALPPPNGASGDGSAQFGVTRLARPSRRFALRAGERFAYMGLELRIGRFDPRDPADRADDRVEVHVTTGGETVRHWWTELKEAVIPIDGVGEARVAVLSVTPLPDSEMRRNEPIDDGEATFDLVIERGPDHNERRRSNE
jgi:hypothetical protein